MRVDGRNVDVILTVAAQLIVRKQMVDSDAMSRDQRRIGSCWGPPFRLVVGITRNQYLRCAGVHRIPHNIDSCLGDVLEMNVGDLVGTPSARRDLTVEQQDRQRTHYSNPKGSNKNHHVRISQARFSGKSGSIRP